MISLKKLSSVAGASTLALFCFAPEARSHSVHQVSLVLNQLSNATMPNKANRQTALNDIMKKCDAHKIYMRYTITKVKAAQDPKKNGNSIAPGGNIPTDAAANDLDKVALNGEIKNGGLKVWVANSMPGTENGSTLVGTPSTSIKEQNGVHGDAQTWAHELGHSLGLSHTSPYNASADTNNLMYPYRLKPTPPNPANTPAGSNLSKAQCEKMLEKMKLRSPTTAKTASQKAEPKGRSKQTAVPDFSDQDASGVPGTTSDIEWGMLQYDEDLMVVGESHFSFTLSIGSQLTTFPPTSDYETLLNLDADPATGDVDGYDAALVLLPFSATDGELAVIDLASEVEVATLPLLVELVSLELTGPTTSQEIPSGTLLSGSVQTPILEGIIAPTPLAPLIPFEFRSSLGSVQDVAGPDLLDIDLQPLALVSIVPFQVDGAGDSLDLIGSNFPPSEPYVVLFDDDEVASGMTDLSGNVMEILVVPPATVSGDYVIDVITDSGVVAIEMLQVGAPAVPMFSLGSVGLLVIAIAGIGARFASRQVRRH